MAPPNRPIVGCAATNGDGLPSSTDSPTAGPPPIRKRTRPVASSTSQDPPTAVVSGSNGATLPGGLPASASSGAAPEKKEYEVGYRRPPVHGQFQKGRTKTGGRQKSARNTATIVKNLLDEKHRVLRNDKQITTTTREIMIAQFVRKAASGDLKSADWLLRLASDGSVTGGAPANGGPVSKASVSAAEVDTLRDHFQREYAAAGFTPEQIETVLTSMGLGPGSSEATE